eukprot:scaffold1475_cov111-Cylindrotheca_fusiformis.AAC.13
MVGPFHERRRSFGLVLSLLLGLFCQANSLASTGSSTKSIPNQQQDASASLLPERPKSGNGRRKPLANKYEGNQTNNESNNIASIPTTLPRLSELMTQHKSGEGEKSNKVRKQKFSNGGYQRRQPWQADFKTSIRTQGRIKKAFSIRYKTRTSKAKGILNALLSTKSTNVNAANVICALTYSAKAMGTHKMEADPELRSLLLQTTDILNEIVKRRLLNTRQLCNACWAIAKHYDRDRNLLPSQPEAVALSSEHAVGTAVALKLDESKTKTELQQARLDETIDEIAVQLTEILNEFDTEGSASRAPAKIGEICMASWAFGKLRHRKTPPGWQVPPQIGRVSNLNSEADRVAMTKDIITFERWGSFGSNDSESEDEGSFAEEVAHDLFDAIGATLCQSPDAVDAKHNVSGAQTFLEECSWSELANVGWSFASHGSCKSAESEMLLLNLAREARRRLRIGGSLLDDLQTRDLAQLLWSLGTLQADNFRLADGLVFLVEDVTNEYLRLDARRTSFGRSVRPLRRWSCADLVQVVLSLAHARIDEIPLLKVIYEESSYRLMEGSHTDSGNFGDRRLFYPWEASVLLWAQARLYLTGAQGVEFEDFPSEVTNFLLRTAGKQSLQSVGIGPQEQANIVWSLTVLENHQSPDSIEVIRRVFSEAAEACRDNQSIQLEHAHQLWQAYFLLEEERPEAVEDVPSWFTEYLEGKWNLEKSRGKLSSARHRSLSQCLQLMGVDHYNEHDEDIDVAIVLKRNAVWTHQTNDEEISSDNVSVAVEFDGPNHFTREREHASKGQPEKPRTLGHTVLKYRLLKKQGWAVVRVPYFEFDRIPFWASMERQRYLQRKLKTHANIKFSEVDVSEYKAMSPDRKSRFD